MVASVMRRRASATDSWRARIVYVSGVGDRFGITALDTSMDKEVCLFLDVQPC